MKWLQFCTLNNIPYYVYKLKETDSIILKQLEKQNHKIIAILYGIICIIKVFPNSEILPIALLNENNIFMGSNKSKKVYYKINALTEAFVLTFSENNCYVKCLKIPPKFYITEYYQKTLERYEEISEIMSQKNIKYRIFQLILLICLKFGYMKSQTIVIPFTLSNKNISILTGVNLNTISKTMKLLQNQNIVHESDKRIIYSKDLLKIYLKFNK